MATTQPILKLGRSDFAWYQIYVIPTDDENDNYDDDSDDDEKTKLPKLGQFFKLGPPDFAWQQIQIIPTDEDNDNVNTCGVVHDLLFIIIIIYYLIELRSYPRDKCIEHLGKVH